MTKRRERLPDRPRVAFIKPCYEIYPFTDLLVIDPVDKEEKLEMDSAMR